MLREEKPAPSGTFHSTLGGVFCQSMLRPISRLMPSRRGPRNCGHHSLASLPPSARALPARASSTPTVTTGLPHKDIRMDSVLLSRLDPVHSFGHGRHGGANFLLHQFDDR